MLYSIEPEAATTAIAELRHRAASIAAIVDRVEAHDRPDVWRGRLASEFRHDLVDHRRRLLGLVGAVPQLLELAGRMEAQLIVQAALGLPGPSDVAPSTGTVQWPARPASP